VESSAVETAGFLSILRISPRQRGAGEYVRRVRQNERVGIRTRWISYARCGPTRWRIRTESQFHRRLRRGFSKSWFVTVS